ncbi:MAG: DNA polymerase III subunit delta, partial [Rhodospirillales bacterium]|nr:DNA polymerase III subunit delta [Rhodospirillales bacterium]
MEIKGGQAQAFVAGYARKPDPKLRVALVYGNDEGLVAERARALAQAVCPDLSDAFQVVELAGDRVEDDPARLLDEFQSISMLGGRRVVRVRPAGDGVVDAVAAVLEAPAGDALVVIEAGNLAKTATLRRLVEAAPAGAAIPCFEDADEAIAKLVDSALAELGLRIEPDAREYVVDNLGGDRGVSRSELEKLVLYKGIPVAGAPADARLVTLDDAMSVIGDTAAIRLDDAVYAAFSGDPGALDRSLDRVLGEGVAPVAAVRALQRHADILHRITGL